MQPSRENISSVDIVAREINARHVATVIYRDLSRRSAETAAYVEHAILSGKRKLARQLLGGGAPADMKLIDRCKVLRRDGAFGLTYAGKPFADGPNEVAARVVVSNMRT
jgi:hypothetical protein